MSQPEQPSKTDLMYEIAYNAKFVPARSSDASVKTVTEGSRTTHLLKNHHTQQYFELDEASNIVWGLIDGERSVDQIYREAQASGKVEEPEAVNSSLLFFAENGILRSAADPILKKRIRVVSSFMTEVTLIWDSTRIFRLIHRLTRPILRTSLFWLSMAIVVVGTVFFAQRFVSIFNDPSNFALYGSTVVGFLFYNFVVLGPVITIHELCHGLALMHYSGKTGEVGTGLFYFGPMFYVDATGYWSLSRRQRIMIMWAGNLSTLLIGAGVALIRLLLPFSGTEAQLLDMAAFWCFYSTLWNLAPPFETDGYHILADVLNVPTLRGDAFTYLKTKILRIFRRQAPALEELSKRKEKILLGYSALAIAMLSYVGFQTVRFTVYMAEDALSWSGMIFAGTFSGGLSGLVYVVGLTSIAYFLLTLSGYGVLVRNQVRKTLARGLKFEAVHDRDLSVFLYTPAHLPDSSARRLESRIREVAGKITSNYEIGRVGPLLHCTLRMGGTSLPLSQVKLHFRRIERGFFQIYYDLVAGENEAYIQTLLAIHGGNHTLHDVLREMAENTQPAERGLVKEALGEFLKWEKENTRQLLTSTFATVWTVELPPSQEYELLHGVIPGLLLEDLTMTSLPGDIEDFKKRTVYGLDSIAGLASQSSECRNNALKHPEKSQLVAFFEPIRGRLIFIGRTERIEKDIKLLGPLFTIQAWAGYLDNLLGDISLSLQSISQSIPEATEFVDLSDGEVWTLHSYVSRLAGLEAVIERALAGVRESVRPCKARLKNLARLFEPDRKSKIPLFDSVLALNAENLESIQYGVRELTSLTKPALAWLKTVSKELETEWKKRKPAYQVRNRTLARLYSVIGPLSAIFVVTGLLQPAALLVLLGIAGSVQVGFGTAYYLSKRTGKIVPRHPSTIFTRTLTPLYALTQVCSNLLSGTGVLNPQELLEKEEKLERKEERVEERIETVRSVQGDAGSQGPVPP